VRRLILAVLLILGAVACDPPTRTPPMPALPAACAGSSSNAMPNPSNVGLPGLPDDGTWTPTTVINGDLNVTTPDITYTDIEVMGSINVMANNTTICRARVHGRVWGQHNLGGGNGLEQFSFRIYDSTVGNLDGSTDEVTADGAIGPGQYIANRNEVYGSDGFRISERQDGSPANVDIFNNFVRAQVHNCELGLHADGVQGFFGGSGNRVVHNTIDARSCGNNSAIFFADCSDSAQVVFNILIGGAFTLRIHDDNGNPTNRDWNCAINNPDDTHDVGPWDIQHNGIVDQVFPEDPTKPHPWDFGPAITTNTECGASTMQWSDNHLVTIDSNYQLATTGAEVLC